MARERSTGWALILDACRHRWQGIALGVLVGLGWTAGKVSVGLLVLEAVDHGIEAEGHGRAPQVVARHRGRGGRGRRLHRARAATSRSARPRWIEADLRERLFAHFQRLHFAFHDRAQTGQLMSRANTDLQQIQAFVVMIPLTISNGVTVLAGHGHPVPHRSGAHRAGAREPPVPQRARHALLAAPAPRGDGHPAGVGRAGRGGRGDGRRRARGEGLRRRAGAGGAAAHRGRRRVRPLDGGRRRAGHASCPRSSCSRTSASSRCSATAATRCSTATSASGSWSASTSTS